MNEAENYFKIFSPIDIFIQNDSFLELFSFAINHDNSTINNWYINNLTLINKFVFYLKNKIDHFLQKNDIDPVKINDFSRISIIFAEELSDNAAVIPGMPTLLNIRGKKVQLTRRESDIVTQVKKGYTSKKIANQLDISNRTVEHHIENIKKKLNCIFKNDLIAVLESQDLFS